MNERSASPRADSSSHFEPSAFVSPSAWRAHELGSKESIAEDLDSRQRASLLDAVNANRSLAADAITRRSFRPRGFDEILSRWRNTVAHGTGLVLLRGLPIEDLDVEDCCRLFYGLGTHLGVAVSQSNDGEKIGHVVNLGGQDRRRRAYQNARSLNLHTDRCDTVGMLCIRPAAAGGLSGYASALAVHNEILESRPELLSALYRGFRLHRFGEQAGDDPLTAQPVPVFSVCEGVPNVVYIRGYIDLALDEGHYVLTPTERDALDYFDEVANRPEFRLDLRLESGEATFTNNARLLHRRNAFEDSDDPAKSRHLLRLWLMDPELPAVPAVQAHKSLTGIARIEGRGTYYQGAGYNQELKSETGY
ncbi:MAG: TauD/TfdA family dioxygenase [Pseudomonadota bacterium]